MLPVLPQAACTRPRTPHGAEGPGAEAMGLAAGSAHPGQRRPTLAGPRRVGVTRGQEVVAPGGGEAGQEAPPRLPGAAVPLAGKVGAACV